MDLVAGRLSDVWFAVDDPRYRLDGYAGQFGDIVYGGSRHQVFRGSRGSLGRAGCRSAADRPAGRSRGIGDQVGELCAHDELRRPLDGEQTPVLLRLQRIRRAFPRFVESLEDEGEDLLLGGPLDQLLVVAGLEFLGG